MSTAVATRTHKPRNTPASLIATEFATRQPQPASEPLSQGAGDSIPSTAIASPVILVLVAFVAVTGLVKLAIGLILIVAKITKKIAHQIAAFWAAQMGSKRIDFRVYQAIFD